MSDSERHASNAEELEEIAPLIKQSGSDSASPFSPSEVSADSSSSSAALARRSRSRGRPLKRKVIEELTAAQPRSKRLRNCYNDRYRELFNNTIEDFSAPPTVEADDPLPPSQIGISIWSAEEKEILFHVLGRKGRHNLKGIAAELNCKSEAEVFIYLELLRKAAAEEQLRARRLRIFDASTIDATFDISQECTTALDLSAEALSVLQQREEERLERGKYDKYWLLTPSTAKWADQCVQEGGIMEGELSEAIPAAALLNLGNFLRLSKRFFMNSYDPEYNWRSYTNRPKAPTIMYTAFSDFHTLVISITKRLVQSILFFAMSRLRAMEHRDYEPHQHVKRCDVLAALKVLGMGVDKKRFWIGIARRCKLRVYEKVRHTRASDKQYSYDEVEQMLGRLDTHEDNGLDDPSTDGINSEFRTYPGLSSAMNSSKDSMSDSSSIRSAHTESDAPAQEFDLPQSNSEEAQDQERDEKAQDDYMEALDQNASREEEQRLWEMLEDEPTEQIKLVEMPEAPLLGRTNRGDLVDWTSWVDYAGEWETLETTVPAVKFAKNQQMNKEKRREPSTSNSDSDTDDASNSESKISFRSAAGTGSDGRDDIRARASSIISVGAGAITDDADPEDESHQGGPKSTSSTPEPRDHGSDVREDSPITDTRSDKEMVSDEEVSGGEEGVDVS